ncbi:MAG TPA: hypothetical protein ENI23_15530 [bacterium]|nr:hypothetical protein [bacterium]
MSLIKFKPVPGENPFHLEEGVICKITEMSTAITNIRCLDGLVTNVCNSFEAVVDMAHLESFVDQNGKRVAFNSHMVSKVIKLSDKTTTIRTMEGNLTNVDARYGETLAKLKV